MIKDSKKIMGKKKEKVGKDWISLPHSSATSYPGGEARINEKRK